ncbi:hypothetical protein CR513_04835 [Mucuna pruriens]|uniref:Uncharacterized protein n=1 Tax=Mucuna pruriens TaxID=157652 RepID=A0A371I6H2_MUCPR|nr:hypothetical protein CR513_04835 [Mucuna pruriens]
MIALKAIHASLTPAHAVHHARAPNARASLLCLCKSNESESESQDPQPEGNAQSQELLAQIAMLQTQKVRLTDFLDERSAYLSQFGEEARAEFDKIGEDALQGLDEAGARITANIESQMLEFEESTELNRLEIEDSENKIVEFEGQMEKERNEGLFFKNLGQKQNAPVDKAKAKEEVEKIKDVNRENNGSQTRKNVYLFFIGLLTFGIVDSIASSSGADWKKVAVLGGILVTLFSLFINEQNKDNKND